jgi:hypothetical protein
MANNGIATSEWTSVPKALCKGLAIQEFTVIHASIFLASLCLLSNVSK